jgi:hypothetical protein
VLVFPQTQIASIEVGEQFVFMNQRAASILLDFDVATVDMGVKSRLTASEKLTSFLDCDEVIGGRRGNLLIEGFFHGGRDYWPEYVSEELGDCRFDFHMLSF